MNAKKIAIGGLTGALVALLIVEVIAWALREMEKNYGLEMQ